MIVKDKLISIKRKSMFFAGLPAANVDLEYHSGSARLMGNTGNTGMMKLQLVV